MCDMTVMLSVMSLAFGECPAMFLYLSIVHLHFVYCGLFCAVSGCCTISVIVIYTALCNQYALLRLYSKFGRPVCSSLVLMVDLISSTSAACSCSWYMHCAYNLCGMCLTILNR